MGASAASLRRRLGHEAPGRRASACRRPLASRLWSPGAQVVVSSAPFSMHMASNIMASFAGKVAVGCSGDRHKSHESRHACSNVFLDSFGLSDRYMDWIKAMEAALEATTDMRSTSTSEYTAPSKFGKMAIKLEAVEAGKVTH